MRRGTFAVVVGVVSGAALALAWAYRFVQDDAYIAFRYADHMARGLGPVWNVGEPPVEGFTSPLWVLGLARAMARGFDPVVTVEAAGLASFAVTLVAAAWLSVTVVRARGAALVAWALAGLCPSVLAYATGGLETSTFVAATTIGLALVLGPRVGVARAALASAALGLAVATRFDAIVLLAPAFAARAWRSRGQPSRLVALAAPAAVVLAPLVVWKLSTFGALLPNTAAAKAGGASLARLARGADYLLAFAKSYGVGLPIAAAVYGLGRRRLSWRARVLAATVLVWFGYVAWVGGDFMEFRFCVPAVAPLYVLIVAGLVRLPRARALVAAFAVSTAAHAGLYALWASDDMTLGDGHGIATIHALAAHVSDDDDSWATTGKALRRAFPEGSHVTIACGAAGAIPYFSRLRTIDLFGLSDPWIARHGKPFSATPGHARTATIAYLVEQRVNLALWWVYDPAEGVPPGSVWVEIPTQGAAWVPALYLVPSPEVDRAIADGRWRTHPAP